jgi:hypothetical protein
MSRDLVERLVIGTRDQAAGLTVKELERKRDDVLIGIMELLRERWYTSK